MSKRIREEAQPFIVKESAWLIEGLEGNFGDRETAVTRTGSLRADVLRRTRGKSDHSVPIDIAFREGGVTNVPNGGGRLNDCADALASQ